MRHPHHARLSSTYDDRMMEFVGGASTRCRLVPFVGLHSFRPPTTVIHRHCRHNSSSSIASGSLSAQLGPRHSVDTVLVPQAPRTTVNLSFGITSTQCQLDFSVGLYPIGLMPPFPSHPLPPWYPLPTPPNFSPLLTLSQAGLLSGGVGASMPHTFPDRRSPGTWVAGGDSRSV